MAQNKTKTISKAAKKVTPASSQGKSGLWLLIGGLVLGIGLYQAINLRWVSDDAFITFRYVKNFIEGQGIVYNPGEYVEGYTHFLWLLILSAAKFIGFDPVNASVNLGIISYAAVLIIYIFIAKKERQPDEQKNVKVFYLPLAAILLALNYDMNIWASGGLETALYTFFISLAFLLWFYTALDERKKLLSVGTVLLCATLTRPDGALFILTAVLLLAAHSFKKKLPLSSIAKKIMLLVLPTLVIGVPYLFWKYNYYGDIFPTPYYAKSASENYFAQGFFYIFLFFRVYASLAIALIACGIFYIFYELKNRHITASESDTDRIASVIAASIAVVVYLIVYVARVGGDFMFARFMIPVLPLLYFIIERTVERLPEPARKYRLIICFLLIGSAFIEPRIRENILFHTDAASGQLSGNWNDDEGGGETRGIADERWVYTRKRFAVEGEMRGSLDVYCDIGKFYEPFFAGLPIKVAIMGGQNSIAYYANFPNCIDVYGLTDSYIAHLPITKRGRIGHEKVATDEYLENRGVHLEFFAVSFKPPETFGFDVAVLEIPQFHSWQIVKVINYDKHIMTELDKRFKAAGIKAILPVYEQVVPYYLKELMPKLSSEDVAGDYKLLQSLYFKKYPDPVVERQMLDYIAAKKIVESGKSK